MFNLLKTTKIITIFVMWVMVRHHDSQNALTTLHPLDKWKKKDYFYSMLMLSFSGLTMP